MTWSVPEGLRDRPGEPTWPAWFRGLPRLADDLLAEWELRIDGPARSGHTAVVLPVRTPSGVAAALKIGWPHDEAAYEHLALRTWDGAAAVRLLRADPRRFALLLERAGPGDLNELPVLEACGIVAELYARLHRPALPQLNGLSAELPRWIRRIDALRDQPGVPRRLIEQAVATARAYAAEPDLDRCLLHTDLHYDNVLAGEREPWLVIDPKPLNGDPAFEVAPLLRNRWREAASATSLRGALRARLEAVVDVAGLDEERVKGWVLIRQLFDVATELESPHPDREWLTRLIVLAKAMQG